MAKTAPFDQHGDRYDEWFDKNADAYRAELEAVRQLMPPSFTQGLEVGVGSGRFAAPLGIQTGVEPSESMAFRAEQHGIQVYRAVAEQLPFPDAAFDCVLMVTVICFVDDILTTFQEAFRVLQPGGCILVGFLDRASELGKQYQAKSRSSVFYRDAVLYSAQEVGSLLAEAGFGNLRFRQTLLPGDSPHRILDGCDQGGFVVARGEK